MNTAALERAARVLYDLTTRGGAWENVPDAYRDQYRLKVRAVLLAYHTDIGEEF